MPFLPEKSWVATNKRPPPNRRQFNPESKIMQPIGAAKVAANNGVNAPNWLLAGRGMLDGPENHFSLTCPAHITGGR